jgi:hypothetical protein
MEDDLPKLAHRTGRLRSLIQGMEWDDIVMQDTHKRLLEPCEKDALEMLAAFRTQYESQQAAKASISLALSYMRQAQIVSAEVEKRYQGILDEIGSVEPMIERAKQQEHAVQSLLLRLQQFIAKMKQTESE